MTEILTESFCERCGTRYTFETATPRRRRMSGLKVLGKGLKNFVMSDDSSLDEALAAARSDVELEATTHQLDAFHKTFNFCMTCRQYTCANCWDAVEGRCLSCSTGQLPVVSGPVDSAELDAGMLIGEEIAPARLAFDAWPQADAAHPGIVVGADPAPAAVDAEEPAAAQVPLAESPVVDAAAVAEVADDGELADTGARAAASEAVAVTEPGPTEIESAPVAAAPAIETEPALEAVPAAEPPANEVPFVSDMAALAEGAPVEPVPASETEPAVEPSAQPAIEPAPSDVAAAPPADSEPTQRARRPRSRFRPGQSLDDEIAAYEARLAAQAAEAPASLAPETSPEPDATADESGRGVWAMVEPEPEAVALEVAAEAEPRAEPEPEAVALEVAAEAEPLAEAEPAVLAIESAPEPAPPAAAVGSHDALEPQQAAVEADEAPVATPAIPAPRPFVPPAQPAPAVPPSTPAAPPSWPTAPRWPAPVQPASNADRAPIGDPLAAALARRATEAMWAASAQDVVRLPMASQSVPTAAVQSCQSCGLSLSATARFCRRCGSRQDG